jgi:hypothetical protein
MKKELFDELLESVREGGAILRRKSEAVLENVGNPLEETPNRLRTALLRPGGLPAAERDSL